MRTRRALLAAALLLAGVLIGLLVAWHGTSGFDTSISRDARVWRDGSLGEVLRVVSAIGYAGWMTVVVAIGGAVVLAVTRDVRSTLLVLVVPGVAAVLNARVLKPLFARSRPEDRIDALGASFAMPSGHATATAAFAAVMVLALPAGPWRRVLGGTIALFAIITGVSRVVLGAHYPTDVVAGWCVGTGLALAGAVVVDHDRRRRAGGGRTQ